MTKKVYKSEKIVTYGKKSFRIVKEDSHIQVFGADSKAEKPKVLYDNEKSEQQFHKWLREQRKKHE